MVTLLVYRFQQADISEYRGKRKDICKGPKVGRESESQLNEGHVAGMQKKLTGG